jgi:hypothetical protein
MNILEGRPSKPTTTVGHRTASPAPPIRSMLDIDSGVSAPRHGSIAGIGVGVTQPPKTAQAKYRSQPVRSLLEPQSPVPSRTTHSGTTSPTVAQTPVSQLHRRSSDAAKHPADRLPRVSDKQRVDLEEDYQFGMLPSIPSQALPKRVTQGGKKHGSMAAAITGELERLPGFTRGRDTGRQNSVGIGNKSKSPSARYNARSQSPGSGLLNTNAFNPMPSPGKFVTDSGKVIDLSSAYRRLSDANLFRSGLSNLPARSGQSRERLSAGESMSPSGGIRLEKDYYQSPDGNKGAVESSDDDEEEVGSSGEEIYSSEASRGRRRHRRKKGSGSEADIEDSDVDNGRKGSGGIQKARKTQTVRSLLGAAEEERE